MPAKDKCFSNCRLFEKPECNPPRCKYVSGPIHSYCRLSHRYKMKKPTCNVTRRIKKGEVETNAKKTITTFVKRSKKHLQFICSDSGVCIAFGKSTDEINRFFKGFTDFSYALSPIVKIGSPSANGFVKEIAYKKEDYRADAILKSSQSPDADNLVYEYLVGIKYVNRIMKRFPCFLETYGLYFYQDEDHWNQMRNTAPVDISVLKRMQLENSINYPQSCQKSKHASILIQHIKSAIPLTHFISKVKYRHFMKNDLLYVLFIIFHALSINSKSFTHYDLHSGNILVYEPEKGKYIQYHYHHEDGTETVFYSPYIPKIIDYGRSFFDNGNLNGRKIYDKICATPECNPKCGARYGFSWLDPVRYAQITSSYKNESHDLRLLNIVKKYMKDIKAPFIPKESTFVEIQKIVNKVVYGVEVLKDDKEYGTKENLTVSPKKIYNVKGAYMHMKNAVRSQKVMRENEVNYVPGPNVLGVLHIYDDGRPMIFI